MCREVEQHIGEQQNCPSCPSHLALLFFAQTAHLACLFWKMCGILAADARKEKTDSKLFAEAEKKKNESTEGDVRPARRHVAGVHGNPGECAPETRGAGELCEERIPPHGQSMLQHARCLHGNPASCQPNTSSMGSLLPVHDVREIEFQVTERLVAIAFSQCQLWFILFIQARYSMGANSVGALQYDTENMEAASVVSISDDDEIEAIYPVFNLKSSQLEPAKSSDGVRKRQVHSEKDIDEVADSVEELALDKETIDHANDASSKKQDSLKWFGVLVPQSLKDCQKKFKEAVRVSCDLATLKVKLSSLQSHYCQLMQEKQDILNSVSVFTD